MTPHAVLPAPTLAAIPVIVVVPTNVPAGQRTIPVPMPARLSAVRLAVTAKTVLPEVRLTPALMSDLPNAAAAIHVPILAVPEQKAAFPAQVIMYQRGFLLPNAVPDAMNADIIQIVTLLLSHVIMGAHIQTLAVSALPASLLRRPRLIRGNLFIRIVLD